MNLTDFPEPRDRGERYSATPFPAYRYVPGLHPHPVRDLAGHSYEPQPRLASHAVWSPDEWRHLDAWRYGIDLFNRFYFWEAHEAWEHLWASTERGAAPSLLIQGLIQIAAALLKTHMAVLGGAQALSAEGLDKLRRVRAEHGSLMGLDLDATIVAFEEYFEPLRSGQLPVIGAAVPLLQLAAGISSEASVSRQTDRR